MNLKNALQATLVFFLVFSLNTAIAQIQGSLEFDGNDNFVIANENPLNIIGTGDFTFEAWIQGIESEQSTHPIVFSTRGDNPNGGGVLLFFHGIWGGSNSKMLCFQIDGNNYLVVNNGTYNGSLLDGQCHHIAISRQGNKISFFADGASFGVVEPSNVGTVNFNGPIWLGKDLSTNNTFNGIISQVRIWKIARSETEITETKDSVLVGDEDNLLAYWEMNDGTGQIVLDKTNTYHGQLGSTDVVDVADPTWTEEGCVEVILASTDDLESIALKIFPNPTHDFLTVDNENNEDLTIQIYNPLGQLLVSEKLMVGNNKIDLRNYPQGIYVINIIKEEKIYTHEIVKL